MHPGLIHNKIFPQNIFAIKHYFWLNITPILLLFFSLAFRLQKAFVKGDFIFISLVLKVWMDDGIICESYFHFVAHYQVPNLKQMWKSVTRYTCICSKFLFNMLLLSYCSCQAVAKVCLESVYSHKLFNEISNQCA